jgi:hypothetical protein
MTTILLAGGALMASTAGVATIDVPQAGDGAARQRDRIGAAHSQSGIMGHHIRMVKERGHLDLVKGLITVEGGCSLPNSSLTAADFEPIPYLAIKGT